VNQRKARRPPKVTRAALERASVHHLQRYPATKEQLRRVLKRRLDRATRRADGEPPDREAVLADIEELLAQLEERGALDDARLARILAVDWLRRGTSPPMIRAKLRQKGVASDLVTEAIEHARAEARAQGADPELAAAASYARRRRLGPFRTDAQQRAERRDKDLASLGRRGFRFDVARRVIDADDPDDLPDPLH